MGIDVGGSSIKWVVLDGEDVVRGGDAPMPGTDAQAVLAAIAGLVRAQTSISAVGLALPGVIDAEAGATLLVPNVPGDWEGLPVAPLLQAELGLPVTLCNDARAFTLAEWSIGAGRGCRNMIAVT